MSPGLVFRSLPSLSFPPVSICRRRFVYFSRKCSAMAAAEAAASGGGWIAAGKHSRDCCLVRRRRHCRNQRDSPLPRRKEDEWSLLHPLLLLRATTLLLSHSLPLFINVQPTVAAPETSRKKGKEEKRKKGFSPLSSLLSLFSS